MANKTISATFFLVLFIVATFEMGTVKGLCEKASQTWTGNCGNTRHCDDQCKSWEGAAHGACHVRNGGKHMCFCYFPGCPTAQQQKELIEAAKKAHAAQAKAAAAAKLPQTKN